MSDSSKPWGGRIVARTFAMVADEYGTICHLCGRPGADTSDHLIPRSRGGDNSLGNLRPAHKGCNSRRGASPLPTVDPHAWTW